MLWHIGVLKMARNFQHATGARTLEGTSVVRSASKLRCRYFLLAALIRTAAFTAAAEVECNRHADLAYTLPPKWPFPSFKLLMDAKLPKDCDLYPTKRVCNKISNGTHFEPEGHIREVIASFLSHCLWRSGPARCVAVDLGANNGWFSMLMGLTGAHVTSIEPQPRFARAVRMSAEANCFDDRVDARNGLVKIQPGADGTTTERFDRGWRAAGGMHNIDADVPGAPQPPVLKNFLK